MKVIIRDNFNKEKVYENVKHIPMVGDNVEWFYNPSPIVKQRVFIDNLQTIVLIVN